MATSWSPRVPGEIGIQPITDFSSTDQHGVGSIIQAKDMGTTDYGTGEFIYLKGVASTLVGSWVKYNADDYSTVLDIRGSLAPVAIAMSASVADTYGWYQIGGKAVGKVLTGFADNGLVYATATAGSIDDAVVAGDRIKRAVGASAIGTPSSGKAEFEIDRPYADDATAA
jgi:hypothetical protein